ncbi:flagellar biosynthesis protein FlhB [Helicobacter sp. 23-1048]
MAADDEKTLPASQHKLRRAKQEGNVGKSIELVGFFVMLVGLALLFFMLPYWVEGCRNIFAYTASLFSLPEFSSQELLLLSATLGLEMLKMILPIFLGLVVMGVLANVGQFGFLLSTKPIEPKLSKINPVTGAKNLFSLKKALDGFMITLKVFIAFIVGFVVFLGFFGDLPTVSRFRLYDQILWFRDKALILIGILLVIFAVMAVADFMIKRFQYMKSLRMSLKELKDETKQYEGNPEVRSRIRQMQQKIARTRMMQEVPKASVVITNPTHYAVAITYTDEYVDMNLPPRVVAKGIDELAIRIKALARESGVRIIENPPLARALYAMVEINDFVHPDLFRAVSEVLKQVAWLNHLQGEDTLYNTTLRAAQKAAQNAESNA